MKSNQLVDLAFEDLCEVIPELKATMNRAYRPTIPGRSYYSEPNLRHKLSFPDERPSYSEYPVHTQNIGDWVKRSIVGDISQVHSESMSSLQGSCSGCYPTQRRSLDEPDSYWLMEKTQQVAQSRGLDGCTCSQYAPEVPQCTCQFLGDSNKVKLETLTSAKQSCYRSQNVEQDVWMNELLEIESQNERLRLQKENEKLRLQKEKLYHSLAVPDPSLEYPYYMGYHEESSIYEQDAPAIPLINNLPEKPPSLTPFQQVPKSSDASVEGSPVSSPRPLKAKSSRPRLCHFLLELLANPQQYSDLVEWVDKEKGVFKFLNSSEVASQWGRRRNKPNMKYENFARSLRTYIAKGILTKPRSKLVYRFTSKVY